MFFLETLQSKASNGSTTSNNGEALRHASCSTFDSSTWSTYFESDMFGSLDGYCDDTRAMKQFGGSILGSFTATTATVRKIRLKVRATTQVKSAAGKEHSARFMHVSDSVLGTSTSRRATHYNRREALLRDDVWWWNKRYVRVEKSNRGHESFQRKKGARLSPHFASMDPLYRYGLTTWHSGRTYDFTKCMQGRSEWGRTEIERGRSMHFQGKALTLATSTSGPTRGSAKETRSMFTLSIFVLRASQAQACTERIRFLHFKGNVLVGIFTISTE
ncbi:hypothetical protein BJ508DRAFT_312779 [Ascobolus immersus RN42]|uniref:Uncharacterized protein n=1 Tax=Ascobolus immersus RN42 TaxID=1160509 RepID=A0A3N4HL52_ASCIM|nr:hypothetical protein BJ508DRAFT_312779 [Ascobolus immersus RN42]